MKKRALCLALAAAMLATGVMAGCGDNTTSSTPTDSSTPTSSTGGDESSTTEGEFKKFDDVKLTMLSCWNGSLQKLPEDQYNCDIAKIIRDKIGVTVEYEGLMMSEMEKLNMMFASGEIPDIVNAPYWGGSGGETGVIKKAAAQGRLMDLSDKYMNYEYLKDAYDIGVIGLSYWEKDVNIYDGALYVLPTQTPAKGDINSITNWCYGVFVRGDVPGALNVDTADIKTSDDLYDFMMAAKEYGFKDVNGNDCIIASTYHEGWDYSGFQMNFNEKKLTDYTINDDGTVSMDIFSDNWVEKHLFMWKLVKNGLMDVECFKCTDDQANEKFGNGTALFGSAQYGVFINALKLTGVYNTNPELRYVPVGPLTYADGSPLVQVSTDGRSGTPVLFFPADCENIDAALTYTNFMNSPEGYILSQYGIEGDTFEYNEDGQPRQTQAIIDRKLAGETATVNEELNMRGIGYMAGNFYLSNTALSDFGESDPGNSAAAIVEQEEYKKMRPVEVLEGYPINSLLTDYENIDTINEILLDTTQKDYRERAYFADTEDEARAILESYQEYVRTAEGGLIEDYLKFGADCVANNENVVD